jgi:hypothetical protein
MKESGEGGNEMKHYFLLQITVRSTYTKIVRNQMGILSLGDLGLLNLEKKFIGFDEKETSVRI